MNSAATTNTWRRRLLSSAAVTAALLVGVGVGVLIPDSTAKLDAAHQEVERLSAQAESLTAAVADAEADGTYLADSLEDAEAEAQAANRELEAAEARGDSRESRLDQREEALDQREQELEQRESVTADIEEDSAESVGATDPDFDRAYAVSVAEDILEDIRSIDHRLKDGIGVSSALSLLSDSFGRLLTAGTPPGVNAADYNARLTTLESFAGDAADLYDVNPTEGSAKYAVAREQTGVLLGSLNSALGTTYTLP